MLESAIAQKEHPMNAFSDLDLLPKLQRALEKSDYVTPTAIQAKAIPEGLAGKDILGCAQTGTGKTAAFVLPILHHLGSNRRRPQPNHPLALILSPTRELAIQISENISKYGQFLKIRSTLVYGGVSQLNQVRSLRRGTPILVATPGRLIDLMEQGHISLSQLKYFVLDEADRMLDMGFLPDLEKIIDDLPDQRQSLFFSATLAPKITKLAQGLLQDPVTIQISPEKRSLDKIEQKLQLVKTSEKISKLNEILSQSEVRRAIVFIRTKRATSKVEKRLQDKGLLVGAIHGDKSQNARQRTLTAFRRGKINILVATDVAARGIDVDDVSHVINYDLPEDAETYVHRIGRTGRAGANGIAITFYTEAQSRDVREIERYLGGESQGQSGAIVSRKSARGSRSESHSNFRGHRNSSGGTPKRKKFGKPKKSRRTNQGSTFDGNNLDGLSKRRQSKKSIKPKRRRDDVVGFSWDRDTTQQKKKRKKNPRESANQPDERGGNRKESRSEKPEKPDGKRAHKKSKKRLGKGKKPKPSYHFSEEFFRQTKKKKKARGKKRGKNAPKK